MQLTVRVSKLRLAVMAWCFSSATSFAACTNLESQGQRFTACSFEAGTVKFEVFNLDRNDEPFRYLASLAREVAQDGKKLSFAMNGGMFDENQRPIGYYVEDGVQAKKLNRRGGGGNFHLKPNGVFYVKGSKAGVMETEAFAKSGVRPDFATQSGPMLVINGKIHPKFSPNGTSRKLRNGVGIDDQGTVTFVISDNAVTFWEFASLFKDDLKAKNALFFDGTVSSLYAPEINRYDGFLPVGPMVGAIELK